MEKCLSVTDLAKILNCSRSTAYALVKTPGFPAARIGKKIAVPEGLFRDWLANGGTERKDA